MPTETIRSNCSATVRDSRAVQSGRGRSTPACLALSSASACCSFDKRDAKDLDVLDLAPGRLPGRPSRCRYPDSLWPGCNPSFAAISRHFGALARAFQKAWRHPSLNTHSIRTDLIQEQSIESIPDIVVMGNIVLCFSDRVMLETLITRETARLALLKSAGYPAGRLKLGETSSRKFRSEDTGNVIVASI